LNPCSKKEARGGEEPPGKKKRLDLMGEWVAGDENNDAPEPRKEDDDVEVYGMTDEKV
jgi:hypothetical protein